MTDPQSIKFVNEVIRPLSERFRDLRDDLANALATWHGTSISTNVTADTADTVDDGREAEGVSRLICSDVVSIMTLTTNTLAVLDAVGVGAVIAKPCVRAMRS